jgi:hypothetical protein
LGPRLLFTELSGRIDNAASEHAWSEFQRVYAGLERRPIWISDARQLQGYDPSTLALGARWFKAFYEKGGRHCIVLAERSLTMLAASTMALGTGVRVHPVGTLERARTLAQELLDKV